MTTLNLLLLLSSHLMIHTSSAAAANIIDANHVIRDGDTIVSSGGMFELGFFSPGTSTNRYVGIWFKTIPNRTVVWVANRETPLPNKSGFLAVRQPGILVLLNKTNGTVWSTNTSLPVKTALAQLLDSGNLVVKGSPDGNPLWQSFDHPTDTIVPGMKFGTNLVTGLETHLTSWKSPDNPAAGDYIHYIDLTGYPQIYTKKNGAIQTRMGPWNGLAVRWRNDSLGLAAVRVITVMNQTQVSLNVESIPPFRLRLSEIGAVELFIWIDLTQEWNSYRVTPKNDCDRYNVCGVNGLCDPAVSPLCNCLPRFRPRIDQHWGKADWFDGCVRRVNLSCQGDKFLKLRGVKLPDTRNSEHSEGLPIEACRTECLKNCSCTAYSKLNMSSMTGCLYWFEDLVDMRNDGGQGFDIYVRVAASELDSGKRKQEILIGSLAAGIGIVLIVVTLFLLCIRNRKNKRSKTDKQGKYGGEDLDVPFFSYSEILKATNDFSDHNKLGEGGFGPVFKGTLKDGQEIAVKCLSRTSTQGIDEFKNEANFIAKLQHRNLVRLLGCCIQKNQNILIYEFMHHQSLDVVLFDQTKKVLLDWPRRFNIINGIAKGLLYLHHDSQLRIIHRDLKPSNILLDFDLNPKISDFGTARSFKEIESTTMTKRVIGTRGYMSPEYAIDGLFSVKSDVFSFGVLILEIVSGKKNKELLHSDHYFNLIGQAWTLYQEGRPLELVDTFLNDLCDTSEVLRSIHVGLLCVQKRTEDRPTMTSVVQMLSKEGALTPPNQPGFFIERDTISDRISYDTKNSINGATITVPEGR